MAETPFPETLRCPTCSGYVSGARTCPTCGAVLPLEDALQSVRSSFLAKADDLVSIFRKRPAYWAAWLLAVVPLFVVPPLMSLAIVFLRKDRASPDPFLILVAAINVVVSIYFWHVAGSHLLATIFDAADWLKSLSLPRGLGLIQI